MDRANAACLLALDAGTSGGKAMVFDSGGRLLAEAAQAWGYRTPPEAAPWGREFDPLAFWRIMCDVAREALARSQAADRVVAIGSTAQRQATILVDGQGEELYAGPNIDLRACFEGARLLCEEGERLHAITGHLPPMMFAACRWLWFRQHRPDICRRTRHLFMMGDWLTWRLCGRSQSAFVTAPSNAAETGLFDVAVCRWSHELLEETCLPMDVLPPVRAAGSQAGELSQEAAEALGLRPGLPVAVSAADTGCGLLGMNLTQPGQAGLVAGWSAPVQLVTSRPVFDPERALWTTCSALPGQWLLEGNPGPAGAAYRWMRDIIMPGSPYEALDELAASAPAGSRGVLALLGPRIADYDNPQLLWGGMLLPEANDLLPIGRAEVVRAALENIAYAVRANLERVEAVGKRQAAELGLGGGLSRSRLFPQIVADVLGRPVRLAPQACVSTLGAAICAACAAGLYSGLSEAAAAMVRPGELLLPERAAQAEYLDTYERWLQVYSSLRQISATLT